MKTFALEPVISVRNILFPTDFSHESMLALPYALAMARRYGSKLYPVHISPEPLGAPASVREGMAALGASPEYDTEQGFALLEAQLPRIPYEMIFKKGDIWAELSEIISAKEIDLIVTGTHGRSRISKMLAGSVAETIFRHAPCPVLTVGPAVSGEPESIVDLHEILFATDFSESSLVALPHAISLAQQNGARLYLLHICEQSSPESEMALKSRLRNLVRPTIELGCEPKAFIEYGPPAERILELANELAVDLIVLGVRHPPNYLEATRHLRLETAYAVASQAVCPLLTIRV